MAGMEKRNKISEELRGETSAIFFAEYLPRLYSAPAARPGAPAWRARLGCALSETSRAVIFPHIFIVFKLVRYLSPLRLTGEVFGGAKEEGAAARGLPAHRLFFCDFYIFFRAVVPLRGL